MAKLERSPLMLTTARYNQLRRIAGNKGVEPYFLIDSLIRREFRKAFPNVAPCDFVFKSVVSTDGAPYVRISHPTLGWINLTARSAEQFALGIMGNLDGYTPVHIALTDDDGDTKIEHRCKHKGHSIVITSDGVERSLAVYKTDARDIATAIMDASRDSVMKAASRVAGH
jgi:hypothetical protein